MRPSYLDLIETEFEASLRAKPVAYSEKVTLFLAHLDRNGEPVADIGSWIVRAEDVLAGIGGGATSLQTRGTWLGDRAAPLQETTTLVYTYAEPEKILAHVGAIRTFAFDYGRGTNQSEVAVLLENADGHWFYTIPIRDA